MAWHILHSLLEQIRTHSTFPGKIWIVVMLIFRIVIVARLGDNIYEDEQEEFICNTRTPGCRNVCYNLFRPISELRYWSLLVIVVCVPPVFFFLYAGHKIYHANAKFPHEEEKNGLDHDTSPDLDYQRNAKRKRKRKNGHSFNKPSAPQLFVVKRLNSTKNFNSQDKDEYETKPPKYSNVFSEDDKYYRNYSNLTTTDNSHSEQDYFKRRRPFWVGGRSRNGYPIYADNRGRKVAFIQDADTEDEIRARQKHVEILKNPQIYRAYWWHVFVRTILEVAFLLGQYYLYGFSVPELFECVKWPCPKTVDCFVSRPKEKTVMIFIMFIIGSVACVLSLLEFYSLGWNRFKYAVLCKGPKVHYVEKRKELAKFAKKEYGLGIDVHHGNTKHEHLLSQHHADELTKPLSLSSGSSETSIESV